MSVLILEDNPITAQDLKEILEAEDIEVLKVCHSAEQALSSLDSCDPDILLVDIKLKGTMTGIEFVERISSDQPKPVIYITANSDNETVKRAIETRPASFLTKPFDEKDVIIAVELAFSKFYGSENTDEVPNKHLFLKDGGKFDKVKIADINYLQAEGSYCKVYTDTKQYLLTCNLNSFHKKLDSEFVRIHRSYAINSSKITSVNSDKVFIGDDSFPVGRSHKDELKRILSKFT